MDRPPPIELPRDLKELLERRGGGLTQRVEAFLQRSPRRCVYVTSERVAPHPLRRGVLGKLLFLPTSQPVLGRLDSKFGGIPYWEEPDLVWKGFQFLGQVNFAEIQDAPPEAPRKGLLALDKAPLMWDTALRVRWYPDPRQSAARPAEPGACVAKWETRLCFRAGWSLPEGDAWEAPLPDKDSDLRGPWQEWEPPGYREDSHDRSHRLFGYKSAGLDEDYGFEPRPGRSDSIADYEMIWRITYDNTADFGWGSNWMYVIIHRDDLSAGRLDQAVDTGANA
jgi:Domain of unknown function (DUF1963)